MNMRRRDLFTLTAGAALGSTAWAQGMPAASAPAATAPAAAAVSASALDLLQDFLREARTGRAEFTQTVTSPPRSGETRGRVRESGGVFEFSRPGRFRFSYRKPFEQLLVSDGQTLWLHDVDLNQVTARPVGRALAGTPALLIASATDLRAIEREFTLQPLPARDGQAWLQALPRAGEGQVQRVEFGLRAGPQGAEPATLVVHDSFGQVSTLRFSRVEINARLAPDAFSFKPPAGAEVLRP